MTRTKQISMAILSFAYSCQEVVVVACHHLQPSCSSMIEGVGVPLRLSVSQLVLVKQRNE
jgi:hypothetical protein